MVYSPLQFAYFAHKRLSRIGRTYKTGMLNTMVRLEAALKAPVQALRI